MKPAEIMERAIKFDKPSRIPRIFYNYHYVLYSDILPLAPITPKSWQPSRGYYPHVYNQAMQFGVWKWKENLVGNDSHKNWKEWKHQNREEIDEWGVIWECGTDNSMGWPVRGPVNTWDKMDDLVIPDGKNPERYKLYPWHTHSMNS